MQGLRVGLLESQAPLTRDPTLQCLLGLNSEREPLLLQVVFTSPLARGSLTQPFTSVGRGRASTVPRAAHCDREQRTTRFSANGDAGGSAGSFSSQIVCSNVPASWLATKHGPWRSHPQFYGMDTGDREEQEMAMLRGTCNLCYFSLVIWPPGYGPEIVPE